MIEPVMSLGGSHWTYSPASSVKLDFAFAGASGIVGADGRFTVGTICTSVPSSTATICPHAGPIESFGSTATKLLPHAVVGRTSSALGRNDAAPPYGSMSYVVTGKSGVATRKSQPRLPFVAAAASHTGRHFASKQPSVGGHLVSTLPSPSTTSWRSALQPIVGRPPPPPPGALPPKPMLPPPPALP